MPLMVAIVRSRPGVLWVVLYGWCLMMPSTVAITRFCPGTLWVVLYVWWPRMLLNVARPLFWPLCPMSGALWAVHYAAIECCEFLVLALVSYWWCSMAGAL